MSGKLDQSLDQILSNQPRGIRGRRGRPVRTKKTVVAAAPTGGIQKKTKAAKATPAAAVAPASGSNKIVVSNLPKDVTEAQIKEYFAKSIGALKKVEISYGPNGTSRGIASVIFHKPDAAAKAIKDLNGLLVDGKPMRIEMVMNASTGPQVKALSERIAQPKSAPKPAANAKPKPAVAPTTAATRGKARKARGGRTAKSSRPVKKTAEQLDSEMADYFENANSAPAAETNGAAAAPAAAGDDAMGDVE